MSVLNVFPYVGVVLFIVGWWLGHYVNRRRFYRRNAAGIEQFASYEQSVALRFYEGALTLGSRLLCAFGILFIVMALALLAPHHH